MQMKSFLLTGLTCTKWFLSDTRGQDNAFLLSEQKKTLKMADGNHVDIDLALGERTKSTWNHPMCNRDYQDTKF